MNDIRIGIRVHHHRRDLAQEGLGLVAVEDHGLVRDVLCVVGDEVAGVAAVEVVDVEPEAGLPELIHDAVGVGRVDRIPIGRQAHDRDAGLVDAAVVGVEFGGVGEIEIQDACDVGDAVGCGCGREEAVDERGVCHVAEVEGHVACDADSQFRAHVAVVLRLGLVVSIYVELVPVVGAEIGREHAEVDTEGVADESALLFAHVIDGCGGVRVARVLAAAQDECVQEEFAVEVLCEL